ncbi:MAG: hypothetical protein AAES65_11410 [Candidatus Thiodiazotropha sp. (ex. Lucinoma kazani)]
MPQVKLYPAPYGVAPALRISTHCGDGYSCTNAQMSSPMTGKGNILNEFNGADNTRKAGDIRTLERLNGIDVDAKRKEAYKSKSVNPL